MRRGDQAVKRWDGDAVGRWGSAVAPSSRLIVTKDEPVLLCDRMDSMMATLTLTFVSRVLEFAEVEAACRSTAVADGV